MPATQDAPTDPDVHVPGPGGDDVADKGESTTGPEGDQAGRAGQANQAGRAGGGGGGQAARSPEAVTMQRSLRDGRIINVYQAIGRGQRPVAEFQDVAQNQPSPECRGAAARSRPVARDGKVDCATQTNSTYQSILEEYRQPCAARILLTENVMANMRNRSFPGSEVEEFVTTWRKDMITRVDRMIKGLDALIDFHRQAMKAAAAERREHDALRWSVRLQDLRRQHGELKNIVQRTHDCALRLVHETKFIERMEYTLLFSDHYHFSAFNVP